VEYKHDRSESDAGNLALESLSAYDKTRGVKDRLATLFLKQNYSPCSRQKWKFLKKKELAKTLSQIY
jgi:hypothetical protein